MVVPETEDIKEFRFINFSLFHGNKIHQRIENKDVYQYFAPFFAEKQYVTIMQHFSIKRILFKYVRRQYKQFRHLSF